MNNVGQQVVNNLTGAQEEGKKQNELLEGGRGERMDAGAERTAIEANPRMATLGKVVRAQIEQREKPLVKERMEGRG